MRASLTVTYPHGASMRTQVTLADAPDRDDVLRLVRPFLEGQQPIHVRLWGPTEGDMFIGGPGSARGRNDRATELLRRSLLHRVPGQDPSTLAEVRGIAVIFDRKVMP
jgi:hypothetical protein